jgi:hypothetical protein
VTRRARGVLLIGSIGLLVAGADCGSPRRPEIRQGSKSYVFNITSNPIPPLAREDVIYTITVRDRETNQPIDNGEGRIFANTLEGARTWDGFTKAPAVGTYTAKLRFVASGQWAIGIQFHSDATKPLEKTEWMQDVLPEREGIP